MLRDAQGFGCRYPCLQGPQWQERGAAAHCEECTGLQGHLCPCFWKLAGNCGIKEKVCKVLRGLLKHIALNLYLQHAVIGPAWENSWEIRRRESRASLGMGWSSLWTSHSNWKQAMEISSLLWQSGPLQSWCGMRNLGAPQPPASLPHRDQQQATAAGRGSASGADGSAAWGSSAYGHRHFLSCQVPLPDGTVSAQHHRGICGHWPAASEGGDESVREHMRDQHEVPLAFHPPCLGASRPWDLTNLKPADSKLQSLQFPPLARQVPWASVKTSSPVQDLCIFLLLLSKLPAAPLTPRH